MDFLTVHVTHINMDDTVKYYVGIAKGTAGLLTRSQEVPHNAFINLSIQGHGAYGPET